MNLPKKTCLLHLVVFLCFVTLFGCSSANKNAITADGSDSAKFETLPASSRSVYGQKATADAVEAIEEHYKDGKTEGSALDDYDLPEKPLVADPLEPWNRFWFSFNDFFYLNMLRPVYSGYEYVTPREFRAGFKNVLANVLFPIRFANNILQGKFMAAGVEFGRFIINSTVGIGGLIDAAKGAKVVVEVDPIGEDFGQTLGTWGVGHGFYIVWPILGPSSLRETVGLGVDQFFDPLFYLGGDIAFYGIGGLHFNAADDILTVYEELKKSSVDPYIATREAYIQFRDSHLSK